MTRAWDSATRSALGAVKRTSHKARGPSRSVEAFISDEYGAGKVPDWIVSPDGRFAAWQFDYSVGATQYYHCGAAFPGLGTRHTIRLKARNIHLPYADSFGGEQEFTVDLNTAGVWQYESVDKLFVRQFGAFGYDPIVPRDSTEPARYIVNYMDVYAAEADRETGVPACGGGYYPSEPPSDLVYDTNVDPTDSAIGYLVWRRDDEDSAWELVFGSPRDLPSPSNVARPTWCVSQQRGELWVKRTTDANKIRVWPIETSYNDAVTGALVTTITIPAGNVNWIDVWGSIAIVASTNGNIYVYNGTTLVGALPSPHDTAAWTYGIMAHGWLIVTEEPDRVHFWRVVAGGLEWRQTIEATADIVGGFADVSPVGEDHAVSRTWQRLYLDHGDGEWKYGGTMPHIKSAYDDGWRWQMEVHRHIVMRLVNGAQYKYRFFQVF